MFMLEQNLEKAFAIIADEDIALGFKALGFEIYSVSNPEEVKAALYKVVTKKNAVCLVQDNIYQEQREIIESYKDVLLPIFVPFSKDSKADLLETLLRDIRRRVTGTF